MYILQLGFYSFIIKIIILRQLFFLRLICFFIGVFTFSGINALTNNFFIKDTFEKNGVLIKYSGVVKFQPSSVTNYETDMSLNLYLASFFIEEITYKGEKYSDRELFGHTFPKEVLSKINVEATLSFKGVPISFTSNISSFEKIEYKLAEDQFLTLKKETKQTKLEFEKGLGFKMKLLKTNAIEFPIDTTLVTNFINDIATNKSFKSEEEQANEYSRLLTEGNIFLNENNYKESFASYTLAKEYAEDPIFINSKIEIVDSYLQKNRISKYRWASKEAKKTDVKKEVSKLKNINYESDFNSVDDKKKFSELYTEANDLFAKNKYNQAITKYNSAKKYTKNKAAINQQIKVLEKFKNKATITANTNKKNRAKNKKVIEDNNFQLKKASKLSNSISVKEFDGLSYSELLKKGNALLAQKEFVKSKPYFEAAKEKAVNNKAVDKILASVNKLAKNQLKASNPSNKTGIINDTDRLVKQLPIKKPVKAPKKEVTDLQDKAAILKAEFSEGVSKRGFIKFKRDEQAVLDAKNRVLIPFGKYEILRYRAGFANVRIKDSVALKSVECTGKNDEYSWSARIYQKPWIETVVDGKGEFADEFNKKVDIYVVDNVSLLPFEEVPQRVRDAYKDPNQFTGTDFVSAFKLWEKENANRPDILARRKEIKAFKEASKNEAYSGADNCKQKVSQAIEDVYAYYKSKGYEINIKY